MQWNFSVFLRHPVSFWTWGETRCLGGAAVSKFIFFRCGSGLSGQVLEEAGHQWVGVDISESMLEVAAERIAEEDITGDVMMGDLGQGLPFKPGSFDGAISISALQWLCYSDKRSHHPPQRLYKLFSSIYSCLSRGSRAVFQFYPENSAQVQLITQQAMKAGFTGGVVVDFPNSTKAKKMFLVLFTGGTNTQLPKGLTEESMQQNQIAYADDKLQRMRELRGKPPKKSRDWVLEKKERRRRQGKDVREDTKYTARKRSGRF